MRNRVDSKSVSSRIELACQRALKAIGLGGVLIASPLWAQSANSQWQSTGGGSWTNAANWSDGVPDGLGSAATFGSAITSPSSITLDGSQTVSSLTFNNSSNAYTLAPGNGGTLVLQNTGTSSAILADQGGSHFITAPLALNSLTQASVVNPGDTLSASNATISGGLTFSGAGTLALATTTISSPSVITASASTVGSGSLNLGNLTVNAPVQFNGPVSNTMSLFQVTTPSQLVNPTQGDATYGLNDFAAVSFIGEPGQVLPGSTVPGFYTQYPRPQQNGIVFIFLGPLPLLDNLDIIGAGQVLAPANYVAQTIRFNTPNGGLVNANGNNMDQFLLPQTNSTFSTTGILVTPNVGSSAILITANSDSNNQNTQLLTSGKDGTGPNMVIWQNNTQGDLILNTGIADSSAGPLSLSIEGLGMVAINATSTYTGSTTLQGASVQIPYNAALGSPTSPININGGTLISQQTLTLDSGGTSPIARSIVVGPSGAGLIASAGTTLTIDGPISGSGTITVGLLDTFTLDPLQSATSNTIAFKTTLGVGTVVIAGDTSNFSGGISVQTGTLQFAPGSGTHSVSSLTLGSLSASLDMTQNNTLLINYGSPSNDPVSMILNDLRNFYGPPENHQIGGYILTSATSPAGKLSVGYADGNTDPGSPAAANQLLLSTTLAGDANLDGTVNFSDLLIVAQNYGKTGEDWAHGDFNYDGAVNFPDLLILAQNYGASLSTSQLAQLPESFDTQWQLAETEIQAGQTDVPEPATTGLLAVGAAALMARRRRRRL